MGENERDTKGSTQKCQKHGWTGSLSDEEQKLKCNTNQTYCQQARETGQELLILS